MGLIRMGVNALNGALSDQLTEYFRGDGLNNTTLCVPATKVVRGKVQNKGTADYISSGSVFDVGLNQAALLVEDGKVWDMIIATENSACGQYRYDSSTAPSILGSGFKDLLPSIKEIGRRFAAGGQATHTMRIAYINLRPLTGIPVGFGNVPFRDGEMNLTINAQGHGQAELQIVDPAAFFEQVVYNLNTPYTTTSGQGADLIKQLKAEMKPKFGLAISKLSAKRIPYDQIIAYADDLAREMNEALGERWSSKGIAIKSLAIELNIDDASKKLIQQHQEADRLGANQASLYAMDRQSINRARETAAGNRAGAMTGFMGMNMAGAGGMQPPPMGMPQPQQYQQYSPGGYGAQPVYGQQPQHQQQQQSDANSWTCSCGTKNTSKFCMNCGKPQPTGGNSWTCSCGTVNTGKFCMNCGKAQPAADGWTCTQCGTVNKGKFCMNCGAKKPAGAPVYKCDKCGWTPSDPTKPPKFCPQCGDPFDDNDIT